ncbi:MAG: xanthine dehydrogenase family protein molybdopterin-binding subunit, partial [Bacteroidetes bacterium]
AGAAGKHMLLAAAAQEWEVDISELTASDGVIREINGERTADYGAMASKAAEMEVPEEVELKEPKDFKLISTSVKNVDGKKIVSGQPLYGLDFHREGMSLAMIEHPPAFGLKVKDFNSEEIKAMPGVKDAFIIDTTIEEPDWSDEKGYLHLIAIVGDSTWQLMQAKKALKVDWEKVSEPESTEKHAQMLEDAILTAEAGDSRIDGDPEAAFENAAKVIERTYTAPFLAHNPMEPMNFFAHVKEDSAELIGPVQMPERLRNSVVKLLDMPAENISVNMTRIGGGFGRRLYVHYGVEAAAISKKIGGPVKLIYTREDDMTQGTYRPAYRSVYKAGLDENNNLIAFSVRGAGLPSGPVFPNRFPAGTVENYIAEDLNVETNVTTGAFRAPSSNFTGGVEQSFLDEVAELAGKDPIDFRLELFDRAINDPVGIDKDAEEGEENPDGKRNDYEPERYAGVLKLVREIAGWGEDKPGVFRGVAAYFCHATYVATVMDLVMENDRPKIKKVWCAVDCGIVINVDAAKNMVAGGVIDGIGHSMYSQLTFKNGSPDQNNFNTYQLIRQSQVPEEIEVHFVKNEIDPTGLGEPGFPPAIGALANALYKATGQRYYNQPFSTADQAVEEIMG